MSFIVKIIFGDIWIFCGDADQFMMFQEFFRFPVPTYAHPAFAEPQVQHFVNLSAGFNDRILSDNADIRRTVLHIGGHVRAFCQKEFQFQLLIGKNQFS